MLWKLKFPLSSYYNIIKPNQMRPLPFSLPNDHPSQPSEPESEPPQARKSKRSAQLSRWSRARALRSGRRLERPISRKDSNATPAAAADLWPALSGERSDEEEESEEDVTGGKPIYMVSDGTGWTAEHSVNAALGQFQHCLVDRGCPVNTHIFSGVSTSFLISHEAIDFNYKSICGAHLMNSILNYRVPIGLKLNEISMNISLIEI